MPYTNELQRCFDIFALTLSLKKNNIWLIEDATENYPALFSLYIEMIQQDKQGFFAQSNDKPNILYSLERSKNFYYFTSDKQLLQTLEQMNTNDATDFMLIPLLYCLDVYKKNVHTSGMLIYKEEEAYKIILVNKQGTVTQINVTTIPSEKIASLCSVLVSNRDNPDFETTFSILHELLTHSFPNKIMQLSYKMHPQKEGNCVVKEIEATLKTALFHCRHDLFASQDTKKIKWNDSPDSVYKMCAYLLAAIKKKLKCPTKPFDLLFDLYLQRKDENWDTYPLSSKMKKKDPSRDPT
ncbi:MAG: hypothetical protein IC227_01080 [Enterococcus lacertideformus]|uniref:Uncharacterized protein n=1 Tax=Enterococcus lacertideformus TaxID=2771493 RepID=A0A931ASY6_9ENTE|nr:hypothetical protein [Enterococcus lacertideformus]